MADESTEHDENALLNYIQVNNFPLNYVSVGDSPSPIWIIRVEAVLIVDGAATKRYWNDIEPWLLRAASGPQDVIEEMREHCRQRLQHALDEAKAKGV